jgi:Zn-dependent M28 family amino/carboxypeptidase
MPIVATPIPAAALSNTDADLLSRVLERSRPVIVRLSLDVGFAGEYTSANVVGEYTGSERPDEIVLLGAHLDSWDLGTGAIDDGAGVSTTTAAAFLIHKMAPKHKRTLRVVAFANEESGIYGGDAYAKAHAARVEKIVLGMELDFGAGPIWRLDSGVKPEALGAIDQIMQVLAPIGVARGDSAASGGPDIGPLRRVGMAAVDLLQDGTDYFDYHHTENDTLDKVDPKNLNQNVAVLSVVAYLAAQAEGDFGSAPVAKSDDVP